MKFREKSIPISFDIAGSDPFGRWFDAIKRFVDCLDYFFLNETQLALLTTKEKIVYGVKVLIDAGVINVIVKLGPDGCIIYDSKMKSITVPTVPLPVVDTTRSGDSFDAAYVLGLRKDWDPVKCAQFANVVAGCNCCKLGATAGVPDFDTAMEKIAEFYGIE